MSARVLIIDPDEDQLTRLRVALEEDGYSVIVARDGLEGFEKFKEDQPNLIITELMMDRLSGFELSTRVATNEEFQAPVIFYTGFYRDERARREVVAKYAAAGYFVKPFQIQALKRAVAQNLSGDEATSGGRVIQLHQAGRKLTVDPVEHEPEPPKEPAAVSPPRGDVEEGPETVMESAKSPNIPEPEVSVPQPESYSAPAEPAQADDWLTELPMFQASSSLPVESPPPVTAETVPAQEEISGELVPEPKSLLVERGKVETPVARLPLLSQPPAPPRFYRSRPLQILAAVLLLGAGLFIVRKPQALFDRKPAAVPHQNSQTPTPPSPLTQAATSQETPSSGTLTNSNPEASRPKTSSSVLAKSPLEAKSDATISPDALSNAGTANVETSADVSKRPPKAGRVSGPNLLISDVTGEAGPPYLRKSKRPDVALDKIRATKNAPLVVRIVINKEGKVIEATPLNESQDNATLSQAVLAVVQSWEFSATRNKSDKNWIRYFSFKATNDSNSTR
jgi:CheY-like chemotaxis protein